MKIFSSVIDQLLEYVDNQQQSLIGTANSKWFNEFVDPNIDTSDIMDKFENAPECGTRSATKEMLDTISVLKRTKEIRSKKRSDFFAGAAIRQEGLKVKFNNKKIVLSDMIKI